MGREERHFRMMILRRLICTAVVMALAYGGFTEPAPAGDLNLKLRYQAETGFLSGRFHIRHRDEAWKPEQTAIIVCDVWDQHHSKNAVDRVAEFAPRLNQLLKAARQQGVVTIHAPSDCMAAYNEHPGRLRAQMTPKAAFVPHGCQHWCSRIPAEERGVYPIDQSDGGADDDPATAEAWAKELAAMGRNPGLPWQKQSDLITIDSDQDYITDKGDEVWNVLEDRGIQNVILTGVHTNMCVLGRPFGLRQMARNGRNVVLMRDMTDTMYNPQRWPYVSHFTGTDLIVSHIERYVCPTITSDQMIGGQPFRFRQDTRPHLVMLIADDEYQTEETLPQFATDHLGRDFRVTILHGSETERHSVPGIDAVRTADVLLVSVRRRVLPEADMNLIRAHVKAGKPVIGLRVASHAFSLRGKQPPAGLADWPEFDAEVFGGNYQGHHRNDLTAKVKYAAPAQRTSDDSDNGNIAAILPADLSAASKTQGGSLYKTSPLAKGTTVLAHGSVSEHPAEPVTWTYIRADGGRSFYSSMGHPDDFSDTTGFVNVLYRGICWAAGIPTTEAPSHDQWNLVDVPVESELADNWYRCAVLLPEAWTEQGTAD